MGSSMVYEFRRSIRKIILYHLDFISVLSNYNVREIIFIHANMELLLQSRK